MRDLTDKPFGVNIAQAFVRDPASSTSSIDQGVKFVTTSAGDPTKYTHGAQGRRAHRVPRRADAARRAEGGRRRRRRARRRGRRGRRLQEPDRSVDDGAAAAGRARRSTCRSSPPAASATARRWRPRSRSAPRACRWARAWCRRPSRRCTTTGSRRSSTPPRPTRCSSTATPRPAAGAAHRAHQGDRPPGRPQPRDFGNARWTFGGDMEASLRSPVRPSGSSTRCGRSPRSSADTVGGFHEIRRAQGERSLAGAF